MEWLFWAALLFVAYTYAGYPLAIQWLARWRPPGNTPGTRATMKAAGRS
jgi:hypothetical protein